MMSITTLLKNLIAEVRGHNIVNSYQGNWNKPKEHRCDLCNSAWKPGHREVHTTQCLLSKAYRMAGMRHPIVRIRPLGGRKK